MQAQRIGVAAATFDDAREGVLDQLHVGAHREAKPFLLTQLGMPARRHCEAGRRDSVEDGVDGLCILVDVDRNSGADVSLLAVRSRVTRRVWLFRRLRRRDRHCVLRRCDWPRFCRRIKARCIDGE